MVKKSSGWSLTWARSTLPTPRCRTVIRHTNILDSISTKLEQAGEHRTQVGAGDHTAVVLDDHLHNTQTFLIANKFQFRAKADYN